MNQKDLIETIGANTGLAYATVEKVLNEQASVICKELGKPFGEAVLHPRLGKLKITLTGERQGRNPATGESIAIPAKRAVHLTEMLGIYES